jgi:RNA polymerase sigma-70 factor, ECF subfamily
VTNRNAADGDLIRWIAEGDVGAFEVIYDRYRAQAFGLALKVTRRRGVAEEVTQDAFLNLWRGAHRFDPSRGRLETWLLSVVRYRALDALRRGARHERNAWLDDSLVERLESRERTDERVQDREQAGHARRLIDELPADQREVIELAYFGGFTQSEIATKMGVPIGTVKGRSRLALEKLRAAVTGDSLLARSG